VKVFRFVTENTVEEKVVERAMAKLQLDNMVIQQGRLVDQNKALSSGELLNILRHGADEIISSSVTISTDEDIDAILRRGEEKTAELNEQLRKRVQDMGGNLLEFRMDSIDDVNDRQQENSDYQENAKALKELIITSWDEGPRLRGQRSYNVDEYYRGVLKSDQKPKKAPLPRPPKQPTIHDFQFYPERLYELLEKETAAYRKRLEARKAGREEEEEFEGLTQEEEEAKDKMLTQGFSNWSRKDFNLLIKACERYGRRDIENITAETEGKTEKEVRAYLKAFKTNYKRINGWERIIERIEKGEERIQRLQDMQQALADKVGDRT
jgi:hypothetical protein